MSTLLQERHQPDHRAQTSDRVPAQRVTPRGSGQARGGGRRSQSPGRGAAWALAPDPGLDRRDAARVAPSQRQPQRARQARRADPA